MSTFQVNLRGVVDLLAHHLYSSPRVYLRELLQNGMDAVTARQQLPGGGPAGRIVLTVSQPGALRVLDNGIGLTAQEMTQLLATIGASSKRDDFDFARGEFLGQFGIGLLSCFLVAEEITVRSRSARTPDAATMTWYGRADGTYRIETAAEPLAEPGTEVTLSGRADDAGWFEPATVRELAASFGSMLPVELIIADHSAPIGSLISQHTPPWHAGRDEARRYCEQTFGFEPLDTITLEVPIAGVTGLAFVLPTPANPAVRPQHRVYLKQMLLSQSGEGLLPEWAFFVRCVIDATGLRPTASREALYDDALLGDTREALGNQVRDWMLRLATVNPTAMGRFLTVHQLGVKAIALHDDQMLRLVREHIPFETSLGDITLAEFTRTFPSVRYTRTVDDFRAVSGVAAAHGYGLVNGGYTYDAALLERIGAIDETVEVLPMDASELAARLDTVPTAEQFAARALLRAASDVLSDRNTEVILRRFDPASLPALYLPDPGATGRAVAQTSAAGASDLWNSVVDAAGPQAPGGQPQLVLNHANPLIRRLIAIPPGDLAADVIGGLYVQSLLAGRHPLRAADTALLNSSYLSLIDRALNHAR